MNDSDAFETIMPAGADRPATIPAVSRDILTEILRDGAQRLLAQAIDAEVGDWIDRRAEVLDGGGRRQVVRNGQQPTRTILTGVGPLEVTQPRVPPERTVVAATAAGLQAARPGGRSEVGDRRRRLGLLEGFAAGVSGHR